MLLLVSLIFVLAACGNNNKLNGDTAKDDKKNDKAKVNLYTSRHYDIDNELYRKFEDETGIKVNVIEGEAD